MCARVPSSIRHRRPCGTARRAFLVSADREASALTRKHSQSPFRSRSCSGESLAESSSSYETAVCAHILIYTISLSAVMFSAPLYFVCFCRLRCYHVAVPSIAFHCKVRGQLAGRVGRQSLEARSSNAGKAKTISSSQTHALSAQSHGREGRGYGGVGLVLFRPCF